MRSRKERVFSARSEDPRSKERLRCARQSSESSTSALFMEIYYRLQGSTTHLNKIMGEGGQYQGIRMEGVSERRGEMDGVVLDIYNRVM